MEIKKNIPVVPARQVLSLLIIAAVFAVVASLEAGMQVWGRGGVILLLAGATVPLLIIALRLVRMGVLNEKNHKLVLGLIFFIHLLSVFLFFPPDCLFDGRPVITLDHAVHYYQVVAAGEVFWDSLRLHFYDPNFMAGYPAGALFDLDMKGAEFFCALLRPLGTAMAFKIFILLSYLTIVFTIYRGSRLLGFSFEESVLGLLVFLAFWHAGKPYASDFRFAGMFSFIFVNHLSFYVAGLMKEFLRTGALRRFFIAGPLAFLIHPTAAILLPVSFIVHTLIERRLWSFRRLTQLGFWCLLVVAVNAIWLVPLFEYLHLKTPSEAYFQIKGFSELVRIMARPSCLSAVALVLLAIGGSIILASKKQLAKALPAGLSAACFLAIAAYGYRMPLIDQMEPGRFFLSMFFFLPPLAGTALVSLMNFIGSSMPGKRRLIRSTVLVLLLTAPLWLAFVSSKMRAKHQITTSAPQQVEELITALASSIDNKGRLMIEDGPARMYGNIHLPGMLPLTTGVEQIGGPYPFTFLRHHYATFQTDKTFGTSLSVLTRDAFEAGLGLYNVHWILSATEQTEEYLAKIASLDKVWIRGRYILWKVHGDSGWVMDGTATVKAGLDFIDVAFEREPGEVILKYHWVDGLQVDAAARIFPVQVGEDPIPFIGLDPGGLREVQIRYHWPLLTKWLF